MAIQEINSIYFVNETIEPKYLNNLFLTQRQEFISDEFLADWFLQVIKHLLEQHIYRNELYDTDKKPYDKVIPTRDRNYKEVSTRLIKRMDSSECVYEARGFDEEIGYPRMLFFLLDDKSFSDQLYLGSVVFTFYFLKVENMGKHHLTQRLVEETDDIKAIYFMNDFDAAIIGEELLKEE